MQQHSYPFRLKDLKRLAITDELTGLYNRRYFHFRLKEEIERAKRSDREVAILLLDLDGLKSVNDMYGHQRGDQLLADFAEVLLAQVRSFDLVARYAGDEFIVILPESGEEEANRIGERIRKAISEGSFQGTPVLKTTTSIGIAIYPVDGTIIDALISSADKGLYAAKRRGKNQVARAVDQETPEDYKRQLRKTRLIGRDEELFLLKKQLSRAMNGDAGAVFITGEMGVGRTRLLREFELRAQQAGALTMLETCSEPSQFIPHQPIRGAIRNFVNTNSQKAYRTMMKLNKTQRNELSRLLPELDPTRLEITDVSRTSSDEEFQLFDAVTQYFILLSESTPLIVLLDDIHWLDEATTKLLIYMMKALDNHRILLVGSFLKGDPGESGGGKIAFYSWVKSFKDITEISTLELQRFNMLHTKELVQSLLGQVLPVVFTNLVHSECEGIPFFVEEILKTLIEKKQLVWTNTGWHVKKIQSLKAPDSIREMIFSRLDILDDEERQVMTMSAVIGRVFDFDTLQLVSGRNEGHLLDILERLETLQLIYQLPTQLGEKYQFKHNKIKEVLYEQLDARRKRKMHRRIAVVMERLHRGKTELVAGELAHHYVQGRMIEKAVRLYRRAGDKAGTLNAEASALRYYARAIKLINQDPQKFSEELSVLHQKMALLFKTQGRSVQAIREFKQAMSVGKSSLTPFRRAQLHRWMAQIHVDNGRYDAASKDIRKAENHLDPDQDDIEILRLEICKASLMLQRGEYEACLEVARKLIDSLKAIQHLVALSDVYDLMATVEYNLGNRDQALRLYSDSLKLRREEKDLSRISKSYNNLAGVFMEAGRWKDALNWYKKCIKIEETSGHFASLSHPYAMVAKILLLQNSLDEAEKYCKHSIEIEEKSQNIPGIAICLIILTEIYIERQDLVSAKKVFSRAETLHSDHDIGIVGQKVVVAKAKLELAEGNWEKALKIADDILRIRKLFGDPPAIADAYMLLGQIEKAGSNPPAANKHFEKAEKLFREIGNRFKLATCLKEKGAFTKAQGNYLASYQYLTSAKNIFAEIGSDNEVTEIIELLEESS